MIFYRKNYKKTEGRKGGRIEKKQEKQFKKGGNTLDIKEGIRRRRGSRLIQ
jgi:hypothetical protein